MIISAGTVFEAAGQVRTADSWNGIYAYLPDATWTQATEGGTLTARSWKTLLNDPHLQAIGFCLTSQILGDGLWFRSRAAARKPHSPLIESLRRQVNDEVAASRTGTALDAGAWLTAADLDTQLLLAGFFGGNGWAIRTWAPNRPGIDRGTCWRVVDAQRVETPPAQMRSPDVVNGVRYRDGRPAAIFVRRFNPAESSRLISKGPEYDEVEIYAADGSRNVVHFAPMRWRADGDLGVPALASGLLFVHQLRELLKAHITGKRIQASNPIVIEVANPEEAAKKYQAAVDAGEADGLAQILFVAKGAGAKFTNASYNGADLEQVANVYLRGLCASIGYPWQFVLCQLTDSNMAAAQAALDQAERTTSIWQRQWIDQAQSHIDHSTIRESWARAPQGTALASVPWSKDLLAGEWQRPRRADANRLRSRQAAVLALQLGYSPSTVHDELGSDFEREQERKAEDRQTSDRTGNPFPPEVAANLQIIPSGAGDEPTPHPTDSGTDPAPEDQPPVQEQP